MIKRTALLLLGTLLLFSASAAAQSDCQPSQCTNPTTLIFDASADHNVVEFGAPKLSSYSVEYWAAGATAPVQSTSIGKPAPDAQNNITVDLATLATTANAVATCGRSPGLSRSLAPTRSRYRLSGQEVRRGAPTPSLSPWRRQPRLRRRDRRQSGKRQHPGADPIRGLQA